MAAKRRIVTPKIAEDGSDLTLGIHGPADADGKQPIADTMTFAYSSIPADRVPWFALEGMRSILSNRWNRVEDDATPADIRAALSEVISAVSDGTWTPGRTFEARDPTDLELAIAEATGTPIADLLKRIEEEVQLDANGEPKLDARGRKMRVFTQRVLEALGDDPAVKPILARLVAERAKRLTAEAKKGGASTLGKLFSTPAPETAAAAQ